MWPLLLLRAAAASPVDSAGADAETDAPPTEAGAAADEVPTEPTEADYRLGPGDVVEVTIYGQADLGGSLELSSRGDVSAFCGVVHLAGATAAEATEKMLACFKNGWLTDPLLKVTVSAHRSQRVEVMGAVSKHEAQYLRGETTLRQLLGSVGLVAEKSNGLVVVTRSDGSRVEVPVLALDGPEGAFLLRGGDVVNVTEGQFVYVGGSVARPGPIPYLEGMTASQAYLKAGGNSGFGNVAATLVVRGDERIRVNLRRVLRGKGDDVELEAEDRVIVPESPI